MAPEYFPLSGRLYVVSGDYCRTRPKLMMRDMIEVGCLLPWRRQQLMMGKDWFAPKLYYQLSLDNLCKSSAKMADVLFLESTIGIE